MDKKIPNTFLIESVYFTYCVVGSKENPIISSENLNRVAKPSSPCKTVNPDSLSQQFGI